MLFLLALKWNLKEKMFSSVKTKTNPNFYVKLAERSNYSFLLCIWWITFFKHLYLMECIELNWLCKNMKKVRSSQAAIFVLNWIKYSFSLRLSLKKWKICVSLAIFFQNINCGHFEFWMNQIFGQSFIIFEKLRYRGLLVLLLKLRAAEVAT